MDLAPVRSLRPVSDCVNCHVAKAGPCGTFPVETRSRIAAASLHRQFAQGTTILPGGRPATRVGIILSGLVKVTSMDEHGNEHLLQLLHPGEFVGDPFGGHLPFSCEAATDVALCMTPSVVFSEALDSDPAACAAHLRRMLHQQSEQHCFHLAMRGRSSLERLAYWIAAQAPFGTADRVISIRILLSRRDLASLLDCTTETLSRSLHRLQDMGLIKLVTPERIEIRDPEGLGRMAGPQEGLCAALLQLRTREWGARAINLPRFHLTRRSVAAG